jgi:hypothetical protein
MYISVQPTLSLVAILQSTSIYDACLGTSSFVTVSYTHFRKHSRYEIWSSQCGKNITMWLIAIKYVLHI